MVRRKRCAQSFAALSILYFFECNHSFYASCGISVSENGKEFCRPYLTLLVFMSEPIIKVEELGKKYTISHEGTRGRYTALRDVISNKARSLVKRSNGITS